MDDSVAYQAQLARLADAASFAVRTVGRWLRQQRETLSEDEIETKAPGDFVSRLDRDADSMLREELLAILPGAGVLSEEHKPIRGDEWRWIIDPLDGTTNFLTGLPHWAVSVALEDRRGVSRGYGDIVFGIVFLPALDRLYIARKGLGAKCNGHSIEMGRPRLQRRSTISHWWPMSTGRVMQGVMDVVQSLHGRVGGIRNIGSPSVEMCLVAHGELDGFFASDMESYDLAAGKLIVEEAGGIVKDAWNGDPLSSGWVLAANAPIHELLTRELKDVFRSAPKKSSK